MTFLNPIMLIGAIFGVLPVIFHFIYKKKAKKHAFTAVRFLIKSQKRSLLFSKLESFLLLLLRILMIVLLSMALAKPVLSSINSKHGSGKRSKTVLLIDNSYSMEQLDKDGVSSFAKGKMFAADLIDSKKALDDIFVLRTSDSDTGSYENKNKDKLIKDINNTKIDYGNHNLFQSVINALNILGREHVSVKRFIFVTDMQKNAWGAFSSNELQKQLKDIDKNLIQFFVVNVGVKKTDNLFIKDISIQKAVSGGQSGLNIVTELFNSSKVSKKDLLLTLYIGEKEAASMFFDISLQESLKKKIFVPINKKMSKDLNSLSGKVTIEDVDGLLIDNERFFSLFQAYGIKVLIVDGDPKPYYYNSESFYLFNALNPGLDTISQFDPTVVTTDKVKITDPDKFDLVVFSNVSTIAPEILDNFKAAFKKGTGFLFTVGENSDANIFNRLFDGLTPAKLRGIKRLKKGEYENIKTVDKSHPILNIFRLPQSGDFTKARFRKFFLINQDYKKNVEYLLSFSKGPPFLVVGDFNGSKSALITSTIDREWNDFAIQPTFLPLMHQLMLYLSDNLKVSNNNLFPGEKKIFKTDGSFTSITVTNPKEIQETIHAVRPPDTLQSFFSNTKIPGIYKIDYNFSNKKKSINNKFLESNFSVNLKTKKESILEKIEDENLKKILNLPDLNIINFDKDHDMQGLIREGLSKAKLWPSLLVTLVLLFFFESLLTFSRKKNSFKNEDVIR